MEDVMLVLAFAISGAVLALIAVAAVAGLYGALFGERIDRCRGCGRYGVTAGGLVHPQGCPDHRLVHIERRVLAYLHHPHLLHH